MITIKRLKELIEKLPDDALVSVYEGEKCGIVIRKYYKSKYVRDWFIEANEMTKKDEYIEGFVK